MSNQESPHEAVDFELRRVARRRIMEVLDGHQKSESETVEQTAQSILEFYKISLRALGNWVADCYESKTIPPSLAVRPAFITWSATAERRRQARKVLDDAEASLQRAVSEINRIEPGFFKQMFSDKPGMQEAKSKKAEADSAVNSAQSDFNKLNAQFEIDTRDLLDDLASSIEELPKDLSFNAEIESAISKHMDKAKKIWNSHREIELEGLREILDLTHVLAKVQGERNA